MIEHFELNTIGNDILISLAGLAGTVLEPNYCSENLIYYASQNTGL